jgi:hypothetical protein
MEPKLNEFFATYERANSESDISRIADLYADVFLFAGRQGVQPVKNEDFLKLLPRRKDHIKSLGLLHSKVISLEEVNLDAKYVLAKTVWRMTFQKATGGTTDTEIFSNLHIGTKREYAQGRGPDRPPGPYDESEGTGTGVVSGTSFGTVDCRIGRLGKIRVAKSRIINTHKRSGRSAAW